MRCYYCHTTENLTTDHKHPRSRGGGGKKHNLQTLCVFCNYMKSDMLESELEALFFWFKYIEEARGIPLNWEGAEARVFRNRFIRRYMDSVRSQQRV